jgi:phenylacetic acid degradation operon negative regulatory protein
MSDAPFRHLANELTQGDLPRVWSVLVTVFGDMAQDPGARIGGSVLQELMGLIGVKPEATRVALHRLRKDGWIDTQKTGRTSRYGLTAQGREESAAASPRIYALDKDSSEAWLILTDPSCAIAPQKDWLRLSQNAFVAPERPGSAGVLAMPLDRGTAFPDWMKRLVVTPELSEHCATFLTRLDKLSCRRAEFACLGPLEVTALRVLIVHQWRRIVLRAPNLPDWLFPEDWQGAVCRRAVLDVLAELPVQTVDRLVARDLA